MVPEYEEKAPVLHFSLVQFEAFPFLQVGERASAGFLLALRAAIFCFQELLFPLLVFAIIKKNVIFETK